MVHSVPKQLARLPGISLERKKQAFQNTTPAHSCHLSPPSRIYLPEFIVTGWPQNRYFNSEILLMDKECKKEVSVVMFAFKIKGAVN